MDKTSWVALPALFLLGCATKAPAPPVEPPALAPSKVERSGDKIVLLDADEAPPWCIEEDGPPDDDPSLVERVQAALWRRIFGDGPFIPGREDVEIARRNGPVFQIVDPDVDLPSEWTLPRLPSRERAQEVADREGHVVLYIEVDVSRVGPGFSTRFHWSYAAPHSSTGRPIKYKDPGFDGAVGSCVVISGDQISFYDRMVIRT